MEILKSKSQTKSKNITIALVGNPNSGKSSLFNQLTGLRQKIGNYPGITVDKKSGTFIQKNNQPATVLDLPGTYSVYPRSKDESIVLEILADKNNPQHPDLVVVIVDASNLKRNLLLLTQVKDMGIPIICALNMLDVADKKGIIIDIPILENRLKIPVIPINARSGKGIEDLAKNFTKIEEPYNQGDGYSPEIPGELRSKIFDHFNITNDYYIALYLNQTETFAGLTENDRRFLRDIKVEYKSYLYGLQNTEILERYKFIATIISAVETRKAESKRIKFTAKLDKFLTHPVFGYLVFMSILLIMFQAIFSWAEIPMDWIDQLFAGLSSTVKNTFPKGLFVDAIAEGIIPGVGGIAIFIPQIALLFAFIAILEDSGYMARVVFLMDRIMRRFGLSGKSVVPLISGVACAIPAIMATRNIENWKERIISIMVIPLMTCSARLPIYVILIALVIPDTKLLGIINLQGLTLLGLYLIGFIAALIAAWVFSLIIKSDTNSFLIMEMPVYKTPRWNNVGLMMLEKSKTFVFQAGKIIIAISLILWVLASFGPAEEMGKAEETINAQLPGMGMQDKEYRSALSSYRLEHSYAAVLGKSLEPVIKPLGFDWKIGIALITSFAAREVFVGTIATIYSVGEDADDTSTIKQKMRQEVNPETGKPVYTTAVAFSLLIFYAFAMQCMSTLAVVYRETKGIKWPIIQFVYMSIMAYVASLIVYAVLK